MGIYHPLAFLSCGWKHRRLILRLARRRIESRHRGSAFGRLWIVLQPLLLLAVYTFAFAVVLRARWMEPSGGEANYALVMFAGMSLFSLFAENVSEAPGLLLSNQIYIKQLRFPVEVLPWVSVVSSLFTLALNLVILLLFFVLLRGVPPVTSLFVPLLLPSILLLTIGLVWLLSAAGLFLRDLSQIAGVATTALLFMSPIFYPAARVPEQFRSFFHLNPFATIIDSAHRSLFYGLAPDWSAVGVVSLASFGVAWLGFVAFMRMRNGFADVL